MTKLVTLPADASPTLDDLFYMINAPGTVPVDRKVTGTAIATMLASAPALTGAFVAKDALVFSVKDYGAIGNGSANDTAAINNAKTAAVAAGGAVYFPPGTYMADGLTITTDDVAFVGPASRTATIKKRANGTLLAVTGDRCSLIDIKIDSNGGSFTGDCITITGATDFLIDGCVVTNPVEHGVWPIANSHRATVRHSTIYGDVYAQNSDDLTVDDCKFYASPYTITTDFYGVASAALTTPGNHADGMRCINSDFYVSTNVFAIHPISRNGAVPPRGVKIADNNIVILANCYGGMTIDTCGDATITGNTFSVVSGTPLYAVEIVNSGLITMSGFDYDGGGVCTSLVNVNNSSDCVIGPGILKNPATTGLPELLRLHGSSAGKHSDRNIVTGVKFYIPTGPGAAVYVYTGNATASADDNDIGGSVYGNASARGIVFDGGSGSIDGNTIRARFHTIGGSAGAIRLYNDTNTLVTGCREKAVTTRFTIAGTGGTGIQLEGNSWQFAAAAPTTQYHFVGERTHNSAPAAGGVPGWVCVTAGTAGTHKAMAVLAA